MEKVKNGKYRHYKGNYYEVIGLVRHSESLEDLVLYKQLYGEFELWVRPLNMFNESVEVKGVLMPRFERVGD
ncbi:MAG: DUF1653 domain-containing protein [Bacteroidia bacterium]|nr:DUF1653 domain-containing protein [Bacteroidia bacterium]